MSASFPRLAATAVLSFSLGAGLVNGCPRVGAPEGVGHIRPNVATDFNPEVDTPAVPPTSYVYEDAAVIGSVELGAHVLIAPHAFVRGDEGQHIRIGDDSNVQDCAGIHALESVEAEPDGRWKSLANRLFTSDGRREKVEHEGPEAHEAKEKLFAVWIGRRVSIAHQALVHGPAWVGDDVFVGMQAQVFNAKVGAGSVVAPRGFVMGVEVPEGRLVGPGVSVLTQEQADALPLVKGSAFETLNRAVVHVNTALAEKYLAQEGRGRPVEIVH